MEGKNHFPFSSSFFSGYFDFFVCSYWYMCVSVYECGIHTLFISFTQTPIEIIRWAAKHCAMLMYWGHTLERRITRAHRHFVQKGDEKAMGVRVNETTTQQSTTPSFICDMRIHSIIRPYYVWVCFIRCECTNISKSATKINHPQM